MTSRDDMVIRPQIDPKQLGAKEQARESRRLAAAKRKRGILRRIVKYKTIMKAQRRARAIARTIRGLNKARAGAAAVRTGSTMAGRAAAGTPWGLLIAAVVVGIAVAIRSISGRSFENLGQQLNTMFLGDLDEEARSKMQIRNQFLGDRELTAIVGYEGKINSQIRSVHKDLYDLALQEQRGRTRFMEFKDFQVNSTIDMLIIRAITLLRTHFRGGRSRGRWEKVIRKAKQGARKGRLHR